MPNSSSSFAQFAHFQLLPLENSSAVFFCLRRVRFLHFGHIWICASSFPASFIINMMGTPTSTRVAYIIKRIGNIVYTHCFSGTNLHRTIRIISLLPSWNSKFHRRRLMAGVCISVGRNLPARVGNSQGLYGRPGGFAMVFFGFRFEAMAAGGNPDMITRRRGGREAWRTWCPGGAGGFMRGKL